MNKKFALLIIPMLVLPLVAFGYAHFTDEVVKKYKLHVGSVFLNVTYFHVDYAKMPDVDNDGVIFGDELNITIYEADDCRWYVLIEADPMTGGFVLNTTMMMHNGGKLPFELKWDVFWDGPHLTDPCYEPPGPANPIGTLPGVVTPGPWSWEMKVYRWHEGVREGPYAPTQVHYKPCDLIEVQQHVNFKQPDPADPTTANWQKDWQCKWIRIWVTFHAEDVYETVSSWEWINPLYD